MSGREDRDRVAASLPFWEDNRSDGTMAPSWRDPDLFPWK